MIKTFIMLLSISVLAACTVTRYDYMAEPNGSITLKPGPAKVHIFGTNIDIDKFQNATAEVLTSKGISVTFVKDFKESDIQVHITKERFHTLEQEYLTGLSFGVIPSWGTRESKFIYRIATPSAQLSIHVNETTYNQILLAPICLFQLPFLTDTRIYRNALSQHVTISLPP